MSDRRKQFADFSNDLLKKWAFGECSNDILIVYLSSSNSVSIYLLYEFLVLILSN